MKLAATEPGRWRAEDEPPGFEEGDQEFGNQVVTQLPVTGN